jgi:hypothetical protein
VDVTEAYLLWRPVPNSAARSQWKLGAFYPPVSLENSDPGWASPYSFSFSAINTWIGEEIRVFGAEWSLRRRLGAAGSPHSIKVLASAFLGNDPAGTLIAFKGWSTHDRQTRLFDELPLPTGDNLEPFRELDGNPGFYVGATWQYGQRLQISALHYDNRADPYAFGNGQWGWDTHFNHIGIKLAGPWGFGVIGQHLRGDTVWILGVTPTGQILGPGPLIDTDFQASFWLLTREQGGHRFSLRYDEFTVGAGAASVDDGHGWTLAYRYRATPRLTMGAEWMRIKTVHPFWTGNGLPASAEERQLQLRTSFQWGATGR